MAPTPALIPARRRLPALFLLLLVVLAAACGNDATTAAPAPSETATPGAPASPDGSGSPSAAPVIDWTAVGSVTLDDRWSLTDCEGDAPLICVDDRGTHAGVVELLTYAQDDPPAAGDEIAWLIDAYDQFALGLTEDRAAGCGDGYVMTYHPAEVTSLDGRPAIAYTFTGTDADGTVREHGFAISSIDGHRRTLVAGNAYDADGCVGPEFETWTVAQVASFSAHVVTLAEGSRLPDPAGLDGVVTGRVTGRDATQLSLDTVAMLSGRAAVHAAATDGQLQEGEDDLPNDVYVRDRSDVELVLPFADEVSVALLDCTHGCELAEVPFADWLDGTATSYGGPQAVYRVTIHDDAVVSIVEQYLP